MRVYVYGSGYQNGAARQIKYYTRVRINSLGHPFALVSFLFGNWGGLPQEYLFWNAIQHLNMIIISLLIL
jgi:hypothetical protein